MITAMILFSRKNFLRKSNMNDIGRSNVDAVLEIIWVTANAFSFALNVH